MTGPPQTGSWWSYLSVIREAAQYAAEDAHATAVACPNDGEPLRTGPNGELYCPFDGYRARA